MTKKYFIGLLFAVFYIGFWISFFIGLNTQHELAILTAKNKLLRRTLHNFQWEVTQAHSRNRELDAMRWFWKNTKLQHDKWVLVLETIYAMSKKYNVRGELGLAVIQRESFFNPLAMSDKGAYGLMQVRLSVWGEELGLTIDNITDIKTNIEAGFNILRIYLDDCNGDEIQALNKYWTGSVIPPHDGYTKRIYSSKFMLTK